MNRFAEVVKNQNLKIALVDNQFVRFDCLLKGHINLYDDFHGRPNYVIPLDNDTSNDVTVLMNLSMEMFNYTDEDLERNIQLSATFRNEDEGYYIDCFIRKGWGVEIRRRT